MGLSLDQLVEDVTYYPDRLLNLRDVDKSLVKRHEIIALVNAIDKELDGKGKVLVRPSGTEPLVRISASAKTIEQVDDIIDRISHKFEELSKERK